MRTVTEIELHQGSVCESRAEFLGVQSSFLCGVKKRNCKWPEIQWDNVTISVKKFIWFAMENNWNGNFAGTGNIYNHPKYFFKKGKKKSILNNSKKKRCSQKNQGNSFSVPSQDQEVVLQLRRWPGRTIGKCGGGRTAEASAPFLTQDFTAWKTGGEEQGAR